MGKRVNKFVFLVLLGIVAACTLSGCSIFVSSPQDKLCNQLIKMQLAQKPSENFSNHEYYLEAVGISDDYAAKGEKAEPGEIYRGAETAHCWIYINYLGDGYYSWEVRYGGNAENTTTPSTIEQAKSAVESAPGFSGRYKLKDILDFLGHLNYDPHGGEDEGNVSGQMTFK